MSKKIQEAYLRLSEAIVDNPPTCSEPEYRELFFNESVALGRPISQFEKIQAQNEAEAKIICSFCPIKALCAEYAIIAEESHGVWGGLSPADRKAIYASAKGNKPGLPRAK